MHCCVITIIIITVKCAVDIHGTHRQISTDFGDTLTFHLVTHFVAWQLTLASFHEHGYSWSQNSFKYFDDLLTFLLALPSGWNFHLCQRNIKILRTHCPEIDGAHLLSPKDEPFPFWTLLELVFCGWGENANAAPRLTRLVWNLLSTSVLPVESTHVILVTPPWPYQLRNLHDKPNMFTPDKALEYKNSQYVVCTLQHLLYGLWRAMNIAPYVGLVVPCHLKKLCVSLLMLMKTDFINN